MFQDHEVHRQGRGIQVQEMSHQIVRSRVREGFQTDRSGMVRASDRGTQTPIQTSQEDGFGATCRVRQ